MSGITGIVFAGVETAFAAVADVVGLGTYFVSPRGDQSDDYDPVTDEVQAGVAHAGVRMILTGVDATELVGTIVTVTDVKILIPSVDLPGITPGSADRIFLQGVEYNVTRYKPIPTGALHIVYCRAR